MNTKGHIWLCVVMFLLIVIPTVSAVATKDYYKMDEVAGNTSIDVNGSITGNYVPTSSPTTLGKINGAWNFTGINAGFIANLSQDTTRTYNFWINPTGYNNKCVLCIDNSGANGRSILWQVTASNTAAITVWDTGNSTQAAFTPSNLSMALRAWTMYTLVIVDNSYLALYENAVLIQRVNIAYAVQKNIAEMTTLGNRWRGGLMDLGLQAAFDEFSYSDTAWSAADIAFVYNSGAGRYPFNTSAGTNSTFSAYNSYNGSSINSFCVTNGSLWGCTTTGIANISGVYTNSSSLQTITYSSNESGGYFNYTVANANVSSQTSAGLWQAEVYNNYDYELVTNFNLNNTGGSINTTNSSITNTAGQFIKINAGTYNFQFNKTGYFPAYNNSFVISALGNYSITFYDIYNATINVTAKDSFTGASISNISVTINTTNYSATYNSLTANMTRIPMVFPLSYTINISSPGYLSNIANVSLSSNQTNYSVTLGSAISFSINFFDENTLTAVNNVTFQVFAGNFSATFSTNNSRYNLTNLPFGDYQIRYGINSSTWYPRSYYVRIPLQSSSLVNLSLYLINVSSSSIFQRQIINSTSLPIPGMIFVVLRAYPGLNNASYVYNIVDMELTDNNGNAVFAAVPNTQAYTYYLLSNFSTYFTFTPEFLTTQFEQLTAVTSFNSLLNFQSAYGMGSTLIYNNVSQYFIANYNDPSNSVQSVCLYVKYTAGFTVIQNSTCSNSYSGIISIPVSSNVTGEYSAWLMATFGGVSQQINDKTINFQTVTATQANVGWLIIAMCVIVGATLGAFINPILGIIFIIGSIAALGTAVIGMFTMSGAIIVGMLIASLITIFVWRK